MSFTIQTNVSDRNAAVMPKIQLSVGSGKNKVIFKKPSVNIALTKGNTNTVQMHVSGLIV